MKYDDVWVSAAEEELAALWLDPAHRPAVTEAANAIDRLLRTNPAGRGESRAQGRRVLFVAPLGITYRVHEPCRLVRVLRVWRYRVRGGD